MLAKGKLILILVLGLANLSLFSTLLKSLAVNEPRIYFLPVGQGDATLITVEKNNILIDAGPSARIVSQLDRLIPFSRRKIDLLFISHPNKDHFGGVFELAKRYRLRAVLLTGVETERSSYKNLLQLIKQQHLPVIYLRRGQEIKLSRGNQELANFLVLWPERELKPGTLLEEKELNDSSIVSLFSSQRVRGLFTGDISAKVEQLLLESVPDLDFLKVPHHGSKYSSSAAFLEKLKPEIALIGVGENSYGHPTPEVLNRLQAVGARILRTDLDGLIELVIKKDGLELLTQSKGNESVSRVSPQ